MRLAPGRSDMNLQADQYFALLIPLSLTLLGLALLACWWLLRQQRFLLWLSFGYVVSSLTLSLQSLLDNQQLAQWSLLTSSLYLSSFWAMAQGISLRYGKRANAKLAGLICLCTLAVLAYYSQVQDELIVRACALNLGLGLLLLLPIRVIFRKPASQDLLEKVLRISYVVLTLYALLRCVLIVSLISAEDVVHLTRSVYWVFMLSASLMFSLWFLIILLATTLRDILGTLHQERDHDPLTQLLNRRAFFEAASFCLRNPRQAPWTLMACDLDHFKEVNDTWGHAAGDQVLVQFAQLLQDQTRRDDLAARFGGEEFIILLAHTDMAHAVQVAERIRRRLQETQLNANSGAITASFGLTSVNALNDLDPALQRADELVYKAKHAGRNCIRTDSPEMRLLDNAA